MGGTGTDEFFDQAMYMVNITDWPRANFQTEVPVTSSGNARLAVWRTDPADGRHIPPPGQDGTLATTATFSLVNSGNRTLRAPKRSWKIDLEAEDDHVAGMAHLDLKAMYNDPAQMREALAWALFRAAGVPSSRHTYAKLAINGRYLGLFSLIEQVDRRFLQGPLRGEPSRQRLQGLLRRHRLRDTRTPGRQGRRRQRPPVRRHRRRGRHLPAASRTRTTPRRTPTTTWRSWSE